MFAIAIHGGAGVINRANLSIEQEYQFRSGLSEALNSGHNILQNNGSAIDAVELAIIALENNELFNAGRGSVFTADGKHEMEASIMRGDTLDAGAVCGIRNVRNPVSLARVVMDRSNHLFLNGTGAEKFAREQGLPFAEDDYFFTQKRYDQLQDAQKNSRIQLDHFGEKKFGTVGAVALDQAGNLAAATSTGGLTNKDYGRIGDTPLIGAGTYANNLTCAVSCTGDGEYFIRAMVAYDVSCLMEYKGFTLQEACHYVIHYKLLTIGGEGGVIAVDSAGNIEMRFNSEGMYRAYRRQGEEPVISIFSDSD